MKLREKEYISQLTKYIESQGGFLIKECSGGSIYYSLGKIERLRISDHTSLKSGIYQLDIILKDNYFICIYHRDIKIYQKIEEVKQWISDMRFAIDLFSLFIESNINEEITKLRKELNVKQNKINHLMKENKDLKKQISEDEET